MPGERYTLKPFPYSSHYWVLRILAAEKAPVRILDVGTATGYLGMMLREKGHYVAGIESHGEWAEKARQHYDAFETADIETFAFPYRGEFDYIIFADVLEHLRDPAAVLRRSIRALKESGKIIISVPNVANVLIRLNLLMGRFEYMDRGILDRTHLRFFTLRSLKTLLREAACKVVDISPTPLPVQLVFPLTEKGIFAPLHEAHYLLVRCWKSLFAYQFVVTARPDFSESPSPPCR